MPPEVPNQSTAAATHPDSARAFDKLSGAVFVVLDANGRIEAINARACALLGLPEAALLGHDFVELSVPPDQRPFARAEHATVMRLAREATHEFELGFQSGDGRTCLVSWRCMPRFDAAGQPVGQLCYGEDITHYRRSEDLVRRSNERLANAMRIATIGEMAAGLAHEINQPLAAIVNYAKACEHFLALPTLGSPDLGEAVREIGAEALRAGDIVRRMRGLARAERNVRVPTSISDLLDELRVLSQADARACDTQMDFAPGPSAPRVHMDRDQMIHAVLNLVRNALESVSADPPGQRRIGVEQVAGTADSVKIRVYDNGPGVEPGIIGRMFDPFCTTKTRRPGLGLSMSRTIVHAHQGRLVYEPAQPRGACFTIELPVSGEETA